MRDPLAFLSETFSNDMPLDYKYVPGAPLDVSIFAYCGALHDPKGREGLHHMLEHAFAIGRMEEVTDAFKNLGGDVELGETDFGYIRFHFLVPPVRSAVESAFAILGSLLLCDDFNGNIESERDVVIGEYKECYPRKSKYELMLRGVQAVYQDSWRARFVDPLGTPETIRCITREELAAHRDKGFCSANMHIVAYGGMKLNDLFTIVQASPFGTSRPGSLNARLEQAAEVPLPLETRHEYPKSRYLSEPEEGSDYYTLAQLPGTFTPEAIELFGNVLDRALFKKVRVENGAYSSSASVATYLDRYELEIAYTSLRPSKFSRVEDAVNAAIDFAAQDEDTFRNEQSFAVKGTFTRRRSGVDICEQAVEDLVRYRRIRPLVAIQASFEDVTMADMAAIAALLTPEHRWTLLSPG